MQPDTERRISVAEAELAQLTRTYDKLDLTIEKLTDATVTIQQLLAVHDNKLETHRATDQELYRLVESKKADTDNKIEAIKKELIAIHEEIYEVMEEKIKEFEKKVEKSSEKTDRRLTLLEKWKWIAIGGAIAVGHMLTKLGSVFGVNLG
jgi:uncharacterized protein YdcH (DUF465 family)